MSRTRRSARDAGTRFERAVADYLAAQLDDDRIDRCAPTVPPEPATRRPSLLSRLRTLRLRSPIVPAQRAPHQTNERTTR